MQIFLSLKNSNGKRSVFKVLFMLLLLSCGLGCASKNIRPVCSGERLGGEPDLKLKSFNQLLDPDLSEQAQKDLTIQYLLERVQYSPYEFIRNGQVYGNVRAMMHLRWKYFNKKQIINTPEDFIRDIATGSNISGQKYIVKMDENQTCPLDALLYNELRYLEEILTTQAAVKAQWEAERAVKISAGSADANEAESASEQLQDTQNSYDE